MNLYGVGLDYPEGYVSFLRRPTGFAEVIVLGGCFL